MYPFPDKCTDFFKQFLEPGRPNLINLCSCAAQTAEDPLEQNLVYVAEIQGNETGFLSWSEPKKARWLLEDFFDRASFAIVGRQGVHDKTMILPKVVVKNLVFGPPHQVHTPATCDFLVVVKGGHFIERVAGVAANILFLAAEEFGVFEKFDGVIVEFGDHLAPDQPVQAGSVALGSEVVRKPVHVALQILKNHGVSVEVPKPGDLLTAHELLHVVPAGKHVSQPILSVGDDSMIPSPDMPENGLEFFELWGAVVLSHIMAPAMLIRDLAVEFIPQKYARERGIGLSRTVECVGQVVGVAIVSKN